MGAAVRNADVVLRGGDVVLERSGLLLGNDAVEFSKFKNPATVDRHQEVLVVLLMGVGVPCRAGENDDSLALPNVLPALENQDVAA